MRQRHKHLSAAPAMFTDVILDRRVFNRLRDLHGSVWVFPAARRIKGILGHLDVLDQLPMTAPGDVRNLWNEAAMSVMMPYHLQRWLNQQNLTGNEIAMRGLYGAPDLDSHPA
jgi:hypothetical protein